MNLLEVKAAINWNTTVQFNKNETIHPETKKVTVWANGWIDEQRLRISIPMDLFTKLLAGEALQTLAFRVEDKISKTKTLPYKQAIVYAFNPGDAGAL